MNRFLKGIIVGLGGVAPGLSGSVLLIIFGLYQSTLEALGNLLQDVRKNLQFLLPLLLGIGVGVLLFSRALNFCLTYFEVPTRYCFLGLIVGTLPMVWQEVKKNGLAARHYLLVIGAALSGLWFFTQNPDTFPQVTDPTLLQSVILGVAVAATAIIPGVDPAVFLSTLGFYEMYLRALSHFDMTILVPMVLGLAVGAVAISKGMSLLFAKAYTVTYAVIFGIFLSMIPNMLTPNCVPGLNVQTAAGLILMALGFGISWFLGDWQNNLQRIEQHLKREENK